MTRLFRFFITTIVCIAIVSCKDTQPVSMEQADIVTDLSIVETQDSESTKPAIITGHIKNRQVYPDVKDIRITIPFFGREPVTLISPIWSDDTFSFQFFPYATRQISMPPYAEEIIISPGDSIHYEIDFADLLSVSCSGNGAENNRKLTIFHNKYYLKNWHWFNHGSGEGDETVQEMFDVYEQLRKEYRAQLEKFIRDEKPSKELEEFCRKEIETDYYMFVRFLSQCQRMTAEDLTKKFKVKEIEPLLDEDYMNGNIYQMAHDVVNWLGYLLIENNGEYESMDDWIHDLMRSIYKATDRKGMMRQILVSEFFNILIEDNYIDDFEKFYHYFSESVTNPVLKLATRDRYIGRKSFNENPKVVSDAILYADKPKDRGMVSMTENQGLKMLRDYLKQNEQKVVYVNVGAEWCRGCVEERPYQRELADSLRNEPLKILNLIFSRNGFNDDVSYTSGGIIEDHILTDDELLGLDPILKLGNGIPYYLLIDKNGIIVDYGMHLRPSDSKTRRRIEELLKE